MLKINKSPNDHYLYLLGKKWLSSHSRMILAEWDLVCFTRIIFLVLKKKKREFKHISQIK